MHPDEPAIPLGSVVAAVTEPRGDLISPRRLGEMLRMPQADLARLARLHRSTLAGRPDSPKVQARLGEIARIVALAADLTGGVGRAVVWFRHQPLAGFAHATAEDLVRGGHAESVIEHLEMLADGVYA